MSLPILDKTNPNPCTKSTLHITLRDLKDKDGEPYDLSACSKFYATIKDALSDADASADAQIDSTNEPTQFVTTYASTGNLDVIFSSTNTDLTAGTLYHIDVAAIWPTGTKNILVRDTIKFDTAVTLSTS